MKLEGIADLPLHTGHVPLWLAQIMKRLSKAIVDVMVIEWGPEKVVERLSNPLWFQGFNNIIGMDWDSSGSTTVTLGILKEVIKPEEEGLIVLGGKGKNARNVPYEIIEFSKKYNVDSEKLAKASRLVAKVDSVLVQDSHTLYHHSVIVTTSGKWGIIQQGMNIETKYARRYHWKMTDNFIVEPHSGIAGTKQDIAVNVIERDREGSRKLVLDLVREKPSHLITEVRRALAILRGQTTLDSFNNAFNVVISPKAKLVYMKPIDINRIQQVLTQIYEANPSNLEEVLLSGLGPSTARAL
ncbi:MAG: DUF763 domain-containing protein, partial [Sulfolobus sp.]|nr:DUF763 domain-containing protein [Sulfolobus sp.]